MQLLKSAQKKNEKLSKLLVKIRITSHIPLSFLLITSKICFFILLIINMHKLVKEYFSFLLLYNVLLKKKQKN